MGLQYGGKLETNLKGRLQCMVAISDNEIAVGGKYSTIELWDIVENKEIG